MSGQALQQVAREVVGEITVPGGVQEMFRFCFRNKFRFCTEGHGLVGNIGDRWMVELDDLRDLFQPWSLCDSLAPH